MRKTVSDLCYILGSDLIILMADFLKQELPKLDRDWWQQCILSQLLGEQRRIFTQRGLESIDDMDLTLLVQIFERNWQNLSISCNLGRDDRAYLNEIKAARDKLAHTPLHKISGEDIYRILDTIGRFASKLSPQSSLSGNINDLKSQIDILNPPPPTSRKKSGKEYPCPIPGCTHIFNGGRGGWDGHVGSLKTHPEWHPEVIDHEERKSIFDQEYPEWLK